MNLKYVLAALCCLVPASLSAQTFPDRPVTLVIPYSPGGGTDLLGRLLATALQDEWDQPVVVENRPGAGSMIGTAYVTQQDSDGYTLLATGAGLATAAATYAELPFDPIEDLTPIAMISEMPYLIVAGTQVASNSLGELLEESKSRPFFLATGGLGSGRHFSGSLFSQRSGVEVDVVHYGGGGEALVDLMGGHADIYMGSTSSSMNAVNSGQVRPIGVLGQQRFQLLPDIEATGEHGITGLDIRVWLGIFGPRDMDDALVEQIEGYEAAEDEYFRARAADLRDIRQQVLDALTSNDEE
jgi:tripartite-type tricarboxylate transporter receptor subunit TctC